ncbi:MAG: hypothetical protein V2I33_08310, partial [Kangiellaceae bacterium]|nr:hypothetical protein [Kangiellaceae bacterium]
ISGNQNVYLTGSKNGSDLYLKSYLGNLNEFLDVADNDVVELADLKGLKLNAFDTYLLSYIDANLNVYSDFTSFADSTVRIDGALLYSRAILLDQINKGAFALPSGVTSTAELLQSETALNEADVQLQGIYSPAEYVTIKTDFYTDYSGESISEFESGNEYLMVKFNDVFSSGEVTPRYLSLAATESVFSPGSLVQAAADWSLTPQHLKLQPLEGSSSIYVDSAAFMAIDGCSGPQTPVNRSATTVSFKKVFANGSKSQFLVEYRGITELPECNTPFYTPTNWSRYEIVELRDLVDPLTVIYAGAYAVPLNVDLNSNDTSAGVINLRSDGSVLIEQTNQNGTWSVENNQLLINTSDGDSYQYFINGSLELGYSVVVRTQLSNWASATIHPGLLVRKDDSLVWSDIPGRYEGHDRFRTWGFALRFDGDDTGAQESLNDQGQWTVSSLGRFGWTVTDNVISAEYFADTDTFQSYPLGCPVGLLTCLKWRDRKVELIAQDGDDYYLMINQTFDFDLLFVGESNPASTGYVGLFKKAN